MQMLVEDDKTFQINRIGEKEKSANSKIICIIDTSEKKKNKQTEQCNVKSNIRKNTHMNEPTMLFVSHRT